MYLDTEAPTNQMGVQISPKLLKNRGYISLKKMVK